MVRMTTPPNPPSLEDRIDVRGDGRIILYKRAGLKNPKWQARLRIPGSKEYKIISTRLARQSAAEAFANNLYDDLYLHVKGGGSVRSKTFAQVFHEWEASVDLMDQRRSRASTSGTVERVRRYAVPYFGAKKIDEIKSTDFQLFWHWRKENYSKVCPSNNTLGRERTAILGVFKFAERFGYISKIPDSSAPKAKPERRPTFTRQEWTVITNKMDDWEKEGENKSISRDRYLAKRYFQVLVSSGIRVGELRKLCWKDFWEAETDFGIQVGADVRGKTGSRDVVWQKGAGKIFSELLYLAKSDFEKLNPDSHKEWKLDRNRLVFCHPDGKPVQTFKRSFYSLLDFADVPVFRNGKARTIYSLRHYYATDRLYEEVSPYLLAVQMGTSVEMLEKFYGQTMTRLAATQITKTRKPTKDITDRFQDL